jgi:hypothetical protein
MLVVLAHAKNTNFRTNFLSETKTTTKRQVKRKTAQRQTTKANTNLDQAQAQQKKEEPFLFDNKQDKKVWLFFSQSN